MVSLYKMAWGKHRSSKAKSLLEKKKEKKKFISKSVEVIESCHVAVLPFSSIVSVSTKQYLF